MRTAQNTALAARSGHTKGVQHGDRTAQASRRETKPALKTTELYAYLAAVVGVLTVGYLIARAWPSPAAGGLCDGRWQSCRDGLGDIDAGQTHGLECR